MRGLSCTGIPLYHWPPKKAWADSPSGKYDWTEISAYVHFPFCRSICEFCGYEKRLVDKLQMREFATHAADQITNTISGVSAQKVKKNALFFGGGTASLMPSEGLEQILETFEREFPGPWVEVTLECEPGTIDRAALRMAKQLGINRVGICAQSFNDSQLETIGRKHTVDDVYKLIDDCNAVGIENLHLDLMYALPQQTLGVWEETLLQATKLSFKHISTYKLYVFEHSAYQRNKVRAQDTFELTEETALACEMARTAQEILGDGNFAQYSLTEFAQPGWECRYILDTFTGKDIIPIGPSAFGRHKNEVFEIAPYTHMFSQASLRSTHDRASFLSNAEAFKRDILLGLWLLKVDIEPLEQKYSVLLSDDVKEKLIELSDQSQLCYDSSSISLKPEHRFFVGHAMEQLAAIRSDHWIVETVSVPDIKVPSKIPICQKYPQLDAVFRMMRRDPQFYHDARHNPTFALSAAEADVTHPAILNLISIIEGEAANESSEIEEIAALWLAVTLEYSRHEKNENNGRD